MRWVMVGAIGFFTGFIAYLINLGIHLLAHLKFSQFEAGIDVFIYSFYFLLSVYKATQFKGTIFFGLLVLIAFNGLYSIVAGILVAIEVNILL